MIGRFLTVGGLTFVSRVAGFVRDIFLAYFLGAGPVADARLVQWAHLARPGGPEPWGAVL